MQTRRRGVRTTTKAQAPTAASIPFSNVKQPSAASAVTVLQIPRGPTVRRLKLDGGLDDRAPFNPTSRALLTLIDQTHRSSWYKAANQTTGDSVSAKILHIIFLPAMRGSDAFVGTGTAMHGSESEFCRRQANRLLKLAEQCSDADVRGQLAVMANEWLERAKAIESPAKPDLTNRA
jgi:hypothetical protein